MVQVDWGEYRGLQVNKGGYRGVHVGRAETGVCIWVTGMQGFGYRGVQVDSGRVCLDMSVLSPHILNRLYPSIDLLDLVFVFFLTSS